MSEIEKFQAEVVRNIDALGKDENFKKQSLEWLHKANDLRYSYNYSFLGRPVIQYPQDIVALQEIVWSTRPDLIIETGIAHGGSLIMSASYLSLLDMTDAIKSGEPIDPSKPKRRVIGVDIDIRAHNRQAIEQHPMSHRIDMIQGSSVSPDIVKEIADRSRGYERVMVMLDSNHTHDHVLAELEAYAPLTSKGCYCIVYDTIIEDLPEDAHPDRPWGIGNNAKTAVFAYLERLNADQQVGTDGERLSFEIDKAIEHKIAVTVAPDGYLKRV